MNLQGGEFIVKPSEFSAIFTPEDFNEEQRLMRQSAQEFMDREVLPHRERFEKKDYAFTEEIMKKMGELGFLGVSVPEQYGGLGMDFVSTMLVCDYLSGVTGSIATAFGAHTGIGTLPILLYGTEEQKKKYLPKLATGEWMGAYCLTEPDAGSDANSGKSKAVLNQAGTHYEITGQKMWISNAGFAQLFIVFARIGDDKNITAFLVENDAENGISMGEEEHKLGIRASSTRQVFFTKTKVPVENLLGEANNGFKIALNALNVGRIKLAAACLDAQRRVLGLAVNYANERKQFGTSISQFGAVKKKIANMAMDIFTSEAGTYRAGQDIQTKIDALVAEGANHQEAELKGIEEYAIECSLLKVYVSEAMQNGADEGLQIYGGMGFSEDAPMEAAWRDARISRIYEGTNEINRLLSIDMLIKRAFKGKVDLLGPAKSVGAELMGIPSFDVPDYSAPLSQEIAMVEAAKKVFLMVAGNAAQKLGTELEKHQQLILAAAEILMEVYMAESAVLRAQKGLSNSGSKAEIMQKLAQLQVYKSVEVIKQSATEAIVSFTENDEQAMMLSGLRRFTKYTTYPNITGLRNEVADYFIAENSYKL